LEFDVRRGNFNDVAALELELTTHTINVDYKKTLHDWTLKRIQSSIQNFANPATGINPLIPNFDRIEFGSWE
jgi:iron complex outermembrane receptor protein